jgi:hypothetical protein
MIKYTGVVQVYTFIQRACTVEFEVFTAVVMKSIIFWVMTPCSLFSCNRRFGGIYRLHLQGRRNNSASKQVCLLAEPVSSTLKMEAIYSSETSVATQQTIRHIPEDDTLHNHRCENLKSYEVFKCPLVLVIIRVIHYSGKATWPQGFRRIAGSVAWDTNLLCTVSYSVPFIFHVPGT